MELSNYEDEEGLIHTNNINIENNTYTIDSIKVSPIYDILKVFDIIISNNHLWKNSKFKLELYKRTCRSGAQIYGIPFEKALENLSGNKQFESSRYYIDTNVDYGIIGMLRSDLRKKWNDKEKKFEIIINLWQVFNLNIPTYYIHAIYDLESKSFQHLDGAFIQHDKEAKEKLLFSKEEPSKDFYKYKVFRLDFEKTSEYISIETVKELMNAFLPLDKLNEEYGIAKKTFI